MNRTTVFRAPAARPARPSPVTEALEARQLMAAIYYSQDGAGNNLAHTSWGATQTNLMRYAAAAYGDGKSTPAGASRPSARVVSNIISQQTTTDRNNRNLSEYLWIFGQFLDHDIDLTNTGTSESLPIKIPTGDAFFDPTSTGTQTMSFSRSLFDSSTGSTSARQQINAITAWIDGSMIYGSDSATAASLRSFSGGKLKTSSGNLLPVDSASGFFMAGDVRANENIALIAMQTVWMREHNTVATRLAKQNPTWNDEKLYQEARKFVIAELQAVVYNEFLPALLGRPLRGYAGYKPSVNPSIANEFSTAIYRFGHSTLNGDIDLLDNQGKDLAEAVDLSDALFNTVPIKTYGIDPVLKYGASSNAGEVDVQVVDQLRSFLFGAPGQGGLDLVALNIQRGRDHGLADYNTLRASMGLPRVTGFNQITRDASLAAKLQQVYGNVNNIDAWVGALAEDHLPGASVGALSSAMIADQFTRLRDGDRLYYENTFAGATLDSLRRTRLSDVIMRNTSLTSLQPNAFVFKINLAGTFYVDGNRNGQLDTGDPRRAGQTIQLLDSTGAIVATTITDPQGRYAFDSIDALDTYTVRVDANISRRILIDRGGEFANLNLAAPARLPPPSIKLPTVVANNSIARTLFSNSEIL